MHHRGEKTDVERLDEVDDRGAEIIEIGAVNGAIGEDGRGVEQPARWNRSTVVAEIAAGDGEDLTICRPSFNWRSDISSGFVLIA